MAATLDGQGAVALITGGASGIGRATADAFAAAGYRVFILDVDSPTGECVARTLSARGDAVEFVEADVADSSQVARAIDHVMQRAGKLDFVMNNAGITGPMATVMDVDEADIERVLAVNLKGAFWVCKHALPVQIAAGGGAILNVASITAMTGAAYFAA